MQSPMPCKGAPMAWEAAFERRQSHAGRYGDPCLCQPCLQPREPPREAGGVRGDAQKDEAHHTEPARCGVCAGVVDNSQLGRQPSISVGCTCHCHCGLLLTSSAETSMLPPCTARVDHRHGAEGGRYGGGASGGAPDNEARRLLWSQALTAALLQERSQGHGARPFADWPR